MMPFPLRLLLPVVVLSPSVVSAFLLQNPKSLLPRSFALRSANPESFYSDDEWHPQDPAHTTPQLLQGIWHQIAQGATMTRGETTTVIYPNMQEKLTPRYLNQLLAHLDVCKDVCDHFGMTTALVPYQQDAKITGFTVKSFRNPDKKDDFGFGYDPFWDDGEEEEDLYAGIDDIEGLPEDPYPEIVNKIPEDDEEIINLTKNWVGMMMSDMGICPFMQGPERAGLPVGDIYYCVDRSTTPEDMYAKYWLEVVRLENHNEKEMSSSLLIAPEFMMDNVELFESFSNTLTQPLTALGVEDLLQLVFFHPQWSFRDGGARTGEGEAANYARRSPWPMINLLRTKQVRAAQKGIPTGLVYKQNEKTLKSIGVDKLETMLRLRDWDEISELKVNRKEIDALKIARDFQETGIVKEEDMSLAYDSTPAANKVDRRQIEEGDLVTVLKQALEKRLGKHGDVTPLSGPETSATAMAVDFLIQELDKVAANGVPKDESTEIKEDSAPVAADPEVISYMEIKEDSAPVAADPEVISGYEKMRQAMIGATSTLVPGRQAMDEWKAVPDVESTGDRGSEIDDVLFGKGGIPEKASDDEFNEGMNPDSFY